MGVVSAALTLDGNAEAWSQGQGDALCCSHVVADITRIAAVAFQYASHWKC